MSNIVESMLKMKKWAVVGASAKQDRASYRIVKLLADRGYDVYPVARLLKTIDGRPVYPTLADLPEKPDVLNMVVNPMTGIEILREAVAVGITHVWLQPGSESPDVQKFIRENKLNAYEGCVLTELDAREDLKV